MLPITRPTSRRNILETSTIFLLVNFPNIQWYKSLTFLPDQHFHEHEPQHRKQTSTINVLVLSNRLPLPRERFSPLANSDILY
jgi:hypothetical protein